MNYKIYLLLFIIFELTIQFSVFANPSASSEKVVGTLEPGEIRKDKFGRPKTKMCFQANVDGKLYYIPIRYAIKQQKKVYPSYLTCWGELVFQDEPYYKFGDIIIKAFFCATFAFFAVDGFFNRLLKLPLGKGLDLLLKKNAPLKCVDERKSLRRKIIRGINVGFDVVLVLIICCAGKFWLDRQYTPRNIAPIYRSAYVYMKMEGIEKYRPLSKINILN
jgi:hypothetical protein